MSEATDTVKEVATGVAGAILTGTSAIVGGLAAFILGGVRGIQK